MGLKINKQKRVPGIILLQPCFEWFVVNEIELIQIKNQIEIALFFFSPFLWFPLSQCAPLFPLLGLQLVRLKYVICEFTRQSFRSFDNQLKLLLPTLIYNIIETIIISRLRDYVTTKTEKENSEEPEPEATDSVDESEQTSKSKSKESEVRNRKEERKERRIYEVVDENDLD